MVNVNLILSLKNASLIIDTESWYGLAILVNPHQKKKKIATSLGCSLVNLVLKTAIWNP